MLSIIAKWTILAGKEDAAIPALRDLASQVQEHEPDTLMYLIHTPDFSVQSLPTPPTNEVIFFSGFTDYAAFEQHLHGPIFQGWLAQHLDLFLTNNNSLFVISEFLDRQAGYIRPAASTAS